MIEAAHTQSDIDTLLKNYTCIVKSLSDNIAREIKATGLIHQNYWKNELNIFDETVTVFIEEDLRKDRFSIDGIRGKTRNTNDRGITINGLSRSGGEEQKFYDGMSETEQEISIRISHVMIHELVHMLQKIKNPEYFLTGDGTEAARLGTDAETSEDNNAPDRVEKYLLYLQCKSEMEAHSAQLAVEMFLRYGEGLSKNDYINNVKSSDLYNHIMKKDDGTYTEEMTTVIYGIIESSWGSYSEL
ncbi:hypothetical protein [Komagataeibacter melaceti]|uniref:hypothetical protein n=1 Tax=Komagataeibacter melaceti TaxID=2766577 RepID=UPI0011E60304|nr:hypothetical protein [Komagataeibacter melaceti]